MAEEETAGEQQPARVVVVRAADEEAATGQTAGILRMGAIDRESVGAEKLWFGLFKNFPGAHSGRHHHGEAETAAYISSGRFRVYFGATFTEFVELGPGDCVFIPPYVPHIEVNESDGPAEGVLVRSPSNIVVSLEPEGQLGQAD